MNSRIVKRIGDIGVVVGGATPSTKTKHYWGGRIPWLSPKDLTGYKKRYISRGDKCITEDGLKSCSTQLVPAGTVLFSSRAPIGYVAIARQPLCTNQGFKSVIPNDNIDSLFLYYLLKERRDYIESQGSGTTFKEVSAAVMKSIEIEIPESIEEQRKIATVLDAIDSKIELNNQINDYLADLGETIASKACRATDGVLGDICCQVSDKEASENASIETYISTESLLQNKGGRQIASSMPASGKVTRYRKGDTLVSNVRPYFKKICYASEGGTCSGDVLVFRANDASYASYLYFCLHQDSFFNHMMQGAKGTKMPRGDKKQIMEYAITKSCDEESLRILNATTDLIAKNSSETNYLAEFRDALLPKLISGEIDVSKVDITQLNNHLSDC